MPHSLEVESPRLDAAAPPTAMLCAGCGTALDGDICPACGLVALPRLTLRAILKDALSHVLDTEGSVLRTLRRLLVGPEDVLEDFLRRRKVGYAGPFAFCGIALVLAGLTISLVGANLGHDAWIPGVLAPLALAGAGRLAFLRGRYNLAEHVVANLYLVGMDCLLTIPAWVLGSVAPRPLGAWLFGGGLVAIAAAHVRGLARLQGGGVRGYAGALATAALALALMGTFLIAFVRVMHAING